MGVCVSPHWIRQNLAEPLPDRGDSPRNGTDGTEPLLGQHHSGSTFGTQMLTSKDCPLTEHGPAISTGHWSISKPMISTFSKCNISYISLFPNLMGLPTSWSRNEPGYTMFHHYVANGLHWRQSDHMKSTTGLVIKVCSEGALRLSSYTIAKFHSGRQK